MELEVAKEYGTEFLLYLKQLFKKFLFGKLDEKKLKKIEDDIARIIKNKFGEEIRINLLPLLFNIPNQLIIEEKETKNIICFDSVITVGNLPIKILDLYKLINFGNMNIMAYPIFSKTFRYMNNNMNHIYRMYVETGGFV